MAGAAIMLKERHGKRPARTGCARRERQRGRLRGRLHGSLGGRGPSSLWWWWGEGRGVLGGRPHRSTDEERCRPGRCRRPGRIRRRCEPAPARRRGAVAATTAERSAGPAQRLARAQATCRGELPRPADLSIRPTRPIRALVSRRRPTPSFPPPASARARAGGSEAPGELPAGVGPPRRLIMRTVGRTGETDSSKLSRVAKERPRMPERASRAPGGTRSPRRFRRFRMTSWARDVAEM